MQYEGTASKQLGLLFSLFSLIMILSFVYDMRFWCLVTGMMGISVQNGLLTDAYFTTDSLCT